ncbi:MAG: Na+-dependent bicarbonate transporter superfamily, partial [Verrucomicrobiota bacterium]
YFGLALAVNFPLNLIFGIPLWIELARRYLAP